MNFLTVGDQHMDMVAPRSRKDNYYESMMEKWEEILEIAKIEKVVAVLLTGDLVHKKDPHRVPYKLTNSLIDMFRKYRDQDTPIMAAMGNHDIQGNSLAWHSQPIGSIVRAEVMLPLWPREGSGYQKYLMRESIPGQKEPLTVQFGGRLYSYDWDKKPEVYYAVDRDPTANFVVDVSHGMLLPDGTTFFGEFSTPEIISKVVPPQNRPDLYVVGHYHDDLGVFSGHNFSCLNFGALSRGSIDEYNLNRAVKIGRVSVTTISGQVKASISAITLKSAKPASDIFFVEEFKKQKQKSEVLQQFADYLKDGLVADFGLLNPDDCLEYVLLERKVSKEIAEKVRQVVQDSKQELGIL